MPMHILVPYRSIHYSLAVRRYNTIERVRASRLSNVET